MDDLNELMKKIKEIEGVQVVGDTQQQALASKPLPQVNMEDQIKREYIRNLSNTVTPNPVIDSSENIQPKMGKFIQPGGSGFSDKQEEAIDSIKREMNSPMFDKLKRGLGR